MEVEINIEKNRPKPKIVIHTKEVISEINDLVKWLMDYNEQFLIDYRKEEVILLKPEEVFRIYAQGQKVVAQTEKDTVVLKHRLYELEERLIGTRLIRISNSEIVNLMKIKSLDLSISGTITMKFDNGEKAFVSRRYVERIKQYIGMS